jgi:hypothetical protein
MEKNINLQRIKIAELSLVLFFILLGAISRLLPHPANFSPIMAMALFGGVYFSKKISLIVPLLAMFVSDIFIGFYQMNLMVFVYGSFLLCVILGFWLKKYKKWYTILGVSLAGSLIFFFLTNFSVWALTPWYAKTLSGLSQCFLMAWPFFKNTLLGDLSYVILFFGLYELVDILIKRKFLLTEKIV